MLLNPKSFVVAAGLAGTLACNAGRHSATGFRLPDDGDARRGKIAFVDNDCHKCHQVSGIDLPKPTVQPEVPVVLGGEVTWKVTDGYLTTSIVNPSHTLARYPKQQISIDGMSRMPHYDNLTVRELTDIVAFLQASYKEVGPPVTHPPY